MDDGLYLSGFVFVQESLLSPALLVELDDPITVGHALLTIFHASSNLLRLTV